MMYPRMELRLGDNCRLSVSDMHLFPRSSPVYLYIGPPNQGEIIAGYWRVAR